MSVPVPGEHRLYPKAPYELRAPYRVIAHPAVASGTLEGDANPIYLVRSNPSLFAT